MATEYFSLERGFVNPEDNIPLRDNNFFLLQAEYIKEKGRFQELSIVELATILEENSNKT